MNNKKISRDMVYVTSHHVDLEKLFDSFGEPTYLDVDGDEPSRSWGVKTDRGFIAIVSPVPQRGLVVCDFYVEKSNRDASTCHPLFAFLGVFA